MEIKILASSSSGNCYFVRDGISSLLLECGISFSVIKQGLGFSVSKLSGCLVTHEHQDHAKAFKDVLCAGVDIYMTAGTGGKLSTGRHHRLHFVKSLQWFDVGTFRILPFAVNQLVI
jgi:phosphoribosyl 1,2-cyclic phosphodiesterase